MTASLRDVSSSTLVALASPALLTNTELLSESHCQQVNSTSTVLVVPALTRLFVDEERRSFASNIEAIVGKVLEEEGIEVQVVWVVRNGRSLRGEDGHGERKDGESDERRTEGGERKEARSVSGMEYETTRKEVKEAMIIDGYPLISFRLSVELARVRGRRRSIRRLTLNPCRLSREDDDERPADLLFFLLPSIL